LAANQRDGETIGNDAALKISVIIPALNEAKNLPQTLAAVRTANGIEVVIVDGGSQDETVKVAKSFQAKVIAAPPGRAMQMNWGADAATGDLLLFLHADTRLPQQWDQWVRQILNRPGVVAGAFNLAIAGEGLGLRLVEWGVGVRSRFFQLPYGDQAIFLTAKVFQELGGFPNLPIMEDFELMRQLKQRGRVEITPVAILTSGRRWQKLGVLRTTLINQLIIAGYFLGISPHQLVSWYRQLGKRKT
jgi:rSAM/selenodomain-associated transferase 2